MNPKQRNWLVLHLLHPERLKQSAMKKKPRAERSGSEECFLIAPEIPVLTVKADSIGESEAGNVCVQSVSSPLVSSPLPLISLFVPIHHSVTQHYYRRLSPEESAILVSTLIYCPEKEDKERSFCNERHHHHPLFRHPCGTEHHRCRYRLLAPCPWLLVHRLSLRHPPRRHHRTGRRHRRGALYGLEPAFHRHLLRRRTGQGRPPLPTHGQMHNALPSSDW